MQLVLPPSKPRRPTFCCCRLAAGGCGLRLRCFSLLVGSPGLQLLNSGVLVCQYFRLQGCQSLSLSFILLQIRSSSAIVHL